ncbi:MAG: DUF4339 domain-containing protein [Pirellulales bacterium]|nr:DUF4339 domain-containing protein [Pirellulales bacterium]
MKAFLAGRRGICPYCGVKFTIPSESTAPEAGKPPDASESPVDAAPPGPAADPASQFERDLELHVAGPQESAVPVGGQAGHATASEEPDLQRAAPAGPADAAAANLAEMSGGEDPAVPLRPAAPIVDPLAEAPAAVWYVRPPSGGQFGPAQPDMVQTWLNEGRISSETFVWREGWADWREAGSVFPALQPAADGALEPPVVSSTRAVPAGGLRRAARRKAGPRLGLIVVLALAAVILLAIFLWILQGGSGHRGPAGHRAAASAAGRVALLPQNGARLALGVGGRGRAPRCVARQDSRRKRLDFLS